MTPINRTLEGKNQTLGGGGVINYPKESDVIYRGYLVIKPYS